MFIKATKAATDALLASLSSTAKSALDFFDKCVRRTDVRHQSGNTCPVGDKRKS